MKIRYLKVQNFKQFKEIELKDIPNLVFLVGKNGSGKSSLLELLWLFWTNLSVENKQISYPRPPIELTHARLGGMIHVTVGLELDRTEINLELPKIPHFMLYQTYQIDGTGLAPSPAELRLGNQVWRDKTGAKKVDVQGTTLDENQVTDVFNKIVEYGRKFRLLTPYRNLQSEPSNLFQRNQYLLPAFYDHTRSRHTNYQDNLPWEKQKDDFQDVFHDKRLDETGSDVSVGSIGPQGRRIQFTSFLEGGGIQETMQLQDFLLQSAETYAIDEPELHLHADLERRLLARLSKLSEEKQVILSTHSPFMVDASGKGAIYLFSPSNLVVTVARIDQSDYWPMLESLGIKPHDFLLFDVVFFVEGNTELEVISIWAEKLGLDFSNVNIIPVFGVGNSKYRIKPLVEATKRIPFERIFLMVDGDSKEETRRSSLPWLWPQPWEEGYSALR